MTGGTASPWVRPHLVVVLLLAVLPWPVALGLRGASALAAWSVLAAGWTGIGWLCLRRSGTAAALALALAPATGLCLSAAAALVTVRLGRPAYPVFATAFLLAALAGITLLHRDRDRLRALRHGAGAWVLVGVAWLAAWVFLAPMCRSDMVLRGGHFVWMDVDSTHGMAIAAAIRGFRLVYPGQAGTEMIYHAGPYALGGLLSWSSGFDLAEAMAGLKAAGQLALVGAAAGLGAAVRGVTGRGRLSPALAVAGTLFLGAPQELLSERSFGPVSAGLAGALGLAAVVLLARRGSNPARGPAALAAAGAAVFCLLYHLRPWYGAAGWQIRGFDTGLTNFLYGHSALWGATGLLLLAALVLDRLAAGAGSRPVAALLPLAALLPASNLFAGVMGLLLTGVAGLERRAGAARRLLPPALLALALLGLMVWALGMIHPATAGRIAPARSGWPVADFTGWMLWNAVWAGWVCLAFRRPGHDLRFPLALGAVTAAAIALPVLKGLPLPCAGSHDHLYPLWILHPLLSALALVAMGEIAGEAGAGRDPSARAATAGGVRAFAGLTALLAAVTGLRLALAPGSAPTGLALEAGRAAALLALALGLRGGWAGHPPLRRAFTAGLALFFLLGALAGHRLLGPYREEQNRHAVRITADEYHAARRLRELAGPADRIATNRRSVPGKEPGRSFVYSALLERPVLMEGWGYGPPEEDPAAFAILQDCDLLFATTDATAARRLVDRHAIRFLLCQPGTDLALAPLPDWLRRLDGLPGGIAAYAVR